MNKSHVFDMAFIKKNTNFILFLTKHVIIFISYFSKIRQIIKNIQEKCRYIFKNAKY